MRANEARTYETRQKNGRGWKTLSTNLSTEVSWLCHSPQFLMMSVLLANHQGSIAKINTAQSISFRALCVVMCVMMFVCYSVSLTYMYSICHSLLSFLDDACTVCLDVW